MDAGFIDLDILVSRIRNPPSKKYFIESVRSYKAGALRASLTSAWVALVFDLIAKYRELSADGEGSAVDFIKTWDKANSSQDLRKLLELEKDILGHAKDKTQILNSIDFTQLSRLREDRHLCAHPAYSAEAELFEPSSELVRLHLVNVVDLVLAREPRQGRAIFDVFDVDVQSVGFPADHEQIIDYVEQRYLQRVRVANIPNFGVVLAKSLVKAVPAEWDAHYSKIESSLVAVKDRAVEAWQDVAASIVRLIDNSEPEYRYRIIAFLARFPAFWDQLQDPTKTALQETVNNIDPQSITDYRVLLGVNAPQFRRALLRVISELDAESVISAVSQVAIPELWSRGISIYRESGSYRGSEENFRKLIVPFAEEMNGDQWDELLNAVVSNGQNWSANNTPWLLFVALRSAELMNKPSNEAMIKFYVHCQRMGDLEVYDDVLGVFVRFGWVRPDV